MTHWLDEEKKPIGWRALDWFVCHVAPIVLLTCITIAAVCVVVMIACAAIAVVGAIR